VLAPYRHSRDSPGLPAEHTPLLYGSIPPFSRHLPVLSSSVFIGVVYQLSTDSRLRQRSRSARARKTAEENQRMRSIRFSDERSLRGPAAGIKFEFLETLRLGNAISSFAVRRNRFPLTRVSHIRSARPSRSGLGEHHRVSLGMALLCVNSQRFGIFSSFDVERITNAFVRSNT